MVRRACHLCRLPGELLVVVLGDKVGKRLKHAVEICIGSMSYWFPYRCSEPLGVTEQGQPQYVVPAGVARMKRVPKDRLRPALPEEDVAAVQPEDIERYVREEVKLLKKFR